MGTKQAGRWATDAEPSWTDDTLPLAVRRELLDSALERIKADKRRGAGHPLRRDDPGHAGESGSESSGPID